MQSNQVTNTEKPRPATRIEAIDQFRGFAILLMVLANYLNNVNTIPAWLKHAPDIGYTVIDLIAPLFVFAIGLTYGMSFRRRHDRDGAWSAYNHFFSRNLALIGLGFLITLVGILVSIYPPSTYWGLLQTLGAAGLITLPFIQVKARYRWFIGVVILAGYQLLLDRYWLDQVINAAHNGPQGALSWGAMLIIATSLGDLYQQEEKRSLFPWLSLILTVVGGLSALIVPLSKQRASASYVLLSLGLSGLLFYVFHLLENRYHYRPPFLTEWGKNPLLLYILHGFLLGILLIPPYPGWYSSAPLWLVFIQASALIAILSWIGVYCNRRGWFLII
jgi:predicted acyltransferase